MKITEWNHTHAIRICPWLLRGAFQLPSMLLSTQLLSIFKKVLFQRNLSLILVLLPVFLDKIYSCLNISCKCVGFYRFNVKDYLYWLRNVLIKYHFSFIRQIFFSRNYRPITSAIWCSYSAWNRYLKKRRIRVNVFMANIPILYPYFTWRYKIG